MNNLSKFIRHHIFRGFLKKWAEVVISSSEIQHALQLMASINIVPSMLVAMISSGDVIKQ